MAPWIPGFAGLVAAASAGALFVVAGTGSHPVVDGPEQRSAPVDVLKLPLTFEANGGRTDSRVRFLSRGSGYTMFLTDRGTVLRLRGRDGRDAVVRTSLVGGAKAPRVEGEGRMSGKVNSFVGDDPSKWRRGIGAYEKVRYESVYPGVDLVYHGTGGRLEYDFVVAPGADPKAPRLRVDGARPRLGRSGDLLLRSAAGTLRHLRPVAYQVVDGRRRSVDASFALDGHEVGFRVGRYDRDRELVIDPVLSYSSFVGGSNGEAATGIAVDSSGSAYVLGHTYSVDFPTTPGAYDTSYASQFLTDAFVTKLSPSGDAFVYATYIGGTSDELPSQIAVDGDGNAYVGGTTYSSNFPTTDGAYDEDFNGGNSDMFVLKLTPDGDGLGFSTFIGASGDESAPGLALHSSGVWIAGQAATGITTVNGYQAASNGFNDAFVAKLNTTGTTMLYSTYLGGGGADLASDIDVDADTGTVFVSGDTSCVDGDCTGPFPTTTGAYQTANRGGWDGFVALINTGGFTPAETLVYSSLIGGENDDHATAVAGTASGGRVAVAGNTASGDAEVDGGFPRKGPAIDTTFAGSTEGFMSEILPFAAQSADRLDYSTFIGGDASDGVMAIDATSSGWYLAGFTSSGNTFPSKNPIQQAALSGEADAFALKFSHQGNQLNLAYSTTFGGAGGPGDRADDIVADGSGHAWIAGTTQANSTGFPTLAGSAQPNRGGGDDAFVMKLSMPVATITSGPSGPTTDDTPTFAYTSPDTDVFFGCRIDGVGDTGWVSCPSPHTFAALPDGAHRFDVRVADNVGTTDGSFASRSFTIDTTPPSTPVLGSPGNGSQIAQATPAFSWQASTDASTSVSSYDFVLDGKATEVDASACSGGTCSFTPAGALADGPHNWSVLARDVLGHASPAAAASFTVTVPPSAALTVSPNPALVGTSVNFSAAGSTDPGGSIAKYEWDLDGDGAFELDTGGTSSTNTTYVTAGDYQAQVRVTDGAGLTATATAAVKINLLPGATAQFGVSVNDGARYTNTPDVTLHLVGPLSATSVLVSNDGGFGNAKSFIPRSELKWTLDSSGPERLPKTVYVRFLPQLTVGLTFTDDIILDETPPKVLSASVAGGSGEASISALRRFRLRVKASDSNSGVAGLQVTANRRKPGKVRPYKTRLTVRAAKRPRFVRARDRALNFSAWRRLR